MDIFLQENKKVNFTVTGYVAVFVYDMSKKVKCLVAIAAVKY